MLLGLIREGLIEYTYPDWNGQMVTRVVTVMEYTEEHGFALVRFNFITEPLWRKHGTFEKDPRFVEICRLPEFAPITLATTVENDHPVWHDAKGYRILTDGLGIFKDEDDFRRFIHKTFRGKITEEIWG